MLRRVDNEEISYEQMSSYVFWPCFQWRCGWVLRLLESLFVCS